MGYSFLVSLIAVTIIFQSQAACNLWDIFPSTAFWISRVVITRMTGVVPPVIISDATRYLLIVYVACLGSIYIIVWRI